MKIGNIVRYFVFVKGMNDKMDNKKLLPCPFCGGEVYITRNECLINGFVSYKLHHAAFNHSRCILAGQTLDNVFETEELAIKAWNKRV